MTTTATAQARIDNALDDSAQALHGAADAVREQASALIDRFRPKIDAVNHYARDEPTKAMLIAAAAGAAVMALVAISATTTVRRRSNSVTNGGLPEPLTLDSQGFASALRDLAARVPQAASAAVGTGKERASAAADSLADTWKTVRKQAAPVVDRIRPQVDAVTSFAKEEPVKLAIGVVLAGAAVAGIAALLRSLSDD